MEKYSEGQKSYIAFVELEKANDRMASSGATINRRSRLKSLSKLVAN